MEKLPPDLEKKLNDEELDKVNDKIDWSFAKGSAEERRFKMKLRLLKKLNQKEYQEQIKNKRKNSRFS